MVQEMVQRNRQGLNTGVYVPLKVGNAKCIHLARLTSYQQWKLQNILATFSRIKVGQICCMTDFM